MLAMREADNKDLILEFDLDETDKVITGLYTLCVLIVDTSEDLEVINAMPRHFNKIVDSLKEVEE